MHSAYPRRFRRPTGGLRAALVAAGVVWAWAMGAGGAGPASAEPAGSVLSPEAARLREDLARLVAESGLDAGGSAAVAVRVLDLGPAAREGGAGRPPRAPRPVVLYEHRADRPMVPASNMKLVVTAACFDRLGPDWPIRTHVGRVPSPRGRGRWDLAVIGGGDPNFSGRFWNGDPVGAFRRWAEVLKGRGVGRLERVLLDDSLFEAQMVHPNWPADQRHAWYEAPVTALAINDNCATVHLAPGEVGGPARVWLEPPVAADPPKGPSLRLTGTVRTVASRREHRYRVDRFVEPDGTVRIEVGGAFWVGAPEAVEERTLADPVRVFGEALVWTLRAEGIKVAGPVVRARLTGPGGAARPDFRCDLVHVSRLETVAAVANTRSQGLYAECLLKLLGAWGLAPRAPGPMAPRQGSWASGREELARWMAERGIVTAGCVLDDGSGLSPRNRLTARALTQVLVEMDRRWGERFRRTLAVAGHPEGSLRSRMRGTAAEGRVFAKTGYIRGTSALSGYVETASGRRLVFAILVNGFPRGRLWKARLLQDKMCIRMVRY